MSSESTKYQIKIDLSKTNNSKVIAYEWIGKKSSVLDVGCACGEFGELLYRNKSCSVIGMEYDSGSAEICRNLGAYEEVICIDLNTADQGALDRFNGKFDYVVFLDVLEHLVNPNIAFESFKRFLKPDGKVIASLPNISFGGVKYDLLDDKFEYKELGVMDRTHLRFFTHESIADFHSAAGLEIIDRTPTIDHPIRIIKRRVSWARRAIVESRPYSYFYQYVVISKPAKNTSLGHNQEKMTFSWKEVNRYYRFRVSTRFFRLLRWLLFV